MNRFLSVLTIFFLYAGFFYTFGEAARARTPGGLKGRGEIFLPDFETYNQPKSICYSEQYRPLLEKHNHCKGWEHSPYHAGTEIQL